MVDGFCCCRCVVSHCFPGQHLMRHFRVSDPSGVNKEILLFRMLLLLLVARVSAVDHVMEKRSRQEQQAATYTGLPTTNKGPTMDMLLTFRLSPSPPPIQIVWHFWWLIVNIIYIENKMGFVNATYNNIDTRKFFRERNWRWIIIGFVWVVRGSGTIFRSSCAR